jgi:hypothetical protein
VINATDAVEQVRSDAQALHKRIQETATKNHAAIRANGSSVAAEASKLASAVRELIEGQRADAKQHLKDAASSLEAAAADTQNLVTASDADLKARNVAALGRVRSATQKLSQAVAAKRASLVKS